MSNLIPGSSFKYVLALTLTSCLAVAQSLPPFAGKSHGFNIVVSDASVAIREFGKQSGVQIMVSGDLLKGKKLNSVTGEHSTDAALKIMLADSGLMHRYVGDKGVVLVPVGSKEGATGRSDSQVTTMRLATAAGVAQVPPLAQGRDNDPHKQAENGIPEILVRDSKVRSLNADIRRSRDEAQPYVIYDREAILDSGAQTVEDFLRQRLTMDTNLVQRSQQTNQTLAGTSQINLRGLGSDETLILIDGRRPANLVLAGQDRQANLNGIPLSAIERIEVLPASASAIYGSSATGGVINIVLRNDYSGVEVVATYSNTFDADAPSRSIGFSAGFFFEEGRTKVMVAGSYSDIDALAMGDRDLTRRGVAALQARGSALALPPNIPPLGATPNIRSSNGSPLFGPGTPSYTFVPAGYAGGGGLSPLLGNAGQYNFAFPNTYSFYNFGSAGLKSRLGSSAENSGITVSARRQFTSSLELFLNLARGVNTALQKYNSVGISRTVAAGAPNNPFGQAIVVTFPTDIPGYDAAASENLSWRVLAGFSLDLPGKWKLQGDYTWNANRSSSTRYLEDPLLSGAISNGTLDVLRDTVAHPLNLTPYLGVVYQRPQDATMDEAGLRVAGPLPWKLPGGSITLVAGIGHRKQAIEDSLTDQVRNTSPTLHAVGFGQWQRVGSAYMETRVPLVSDGNSRAGLRLLDLQLAARYEDFVVTSNSLAGGAFLPVAVPPVISRASYTSLNPTVGLRYRPLESLMFRASFGQGFLPPTYSQLLVNSTPSSFSVSDPRRGNTTVAVSRFTGGNADLLPESSENWNAGLVVEPRAMQGLRVALDYYHVEKTDQIATLGAQVIVNNEASFTDRVRRGPAPVGDPYGVGPILEVNARLFNLTRAVTEGFDLSLDYQLQTAGVGSWTLFGQATAVDNFRQQATLNAPMLDTVGDPWNGGPLELRFNAGLTWEHQNWSAGWTGRYYDAYTIASQGAAYVTTQGSAIVPSQQYHDVFVSYRLAGNGNAGGWRSWLPGDTEILFGIKNVLDADPPLDIIHSPYYFSPYGDPRLRNYYLTIRTAL